MTLEELITRLREADQDHVVRDGFTEPHSYRGNYADVAFVPAQNVRVSDMLRDAEFALGTTYQGWKGGDYTMHGYVDCHLAEQGDTGEEIGPTLLRLMLETRGEAPRAFRGRAEDRGRDDAERPDLLQRLQDSVDAARRNRR